jgi:hypothetical protein
MYWGPSSSVKVMLPVYSPHSIGWTTNSNFYFPPEGMVNFFALSQFSKSVYTLRLIGFYW